jgi:predicted GIY-YIG superfamily endonuclease
MSDSNTNGITYYVYELNNGKGEVYYGVTKCPKRRFMEHKNPRAHCLTSSRKLGNNFEMNVLQDYDNLVDARLTEELLIRNCSCVNDNTPSNIIVKWAEGDKKENHRVYSQQWHVTNAERISAQKKIYYQNNKEVIKERQLAYWRKKNNKTI